MSSCNGRGSLPGQGYQPGLAVTLADVDGMRSGVTVPGRDIMNVNARRAEQNSPAHGDDLVADQPQRSGLRAERDHRRVALEIPDHIGEHGAVQWLQVVKERVD